MALARAVIPVKGISGDGSNHADSVSMNVTCHFTTKYSSQHIPGKIQ
jgi:hypothetical protein